jgi:formate hydrogenlyase subunit 3/multisubunit Na+/H+ antiporter MnhD subunit
MYQLLLVSMLLIITSALCACFASFRTTTWRHLHFITLGSGGLLTTFISFYILIQHITLVWQLPLGLPWLPWHQQVDSLSAFFLLLVGIGTTVTALYAPKYIREYKYLGQPFTPLGLATSLFILGMMLVITAADAFSFMIAWELMSVSSYFLVTYQHQHSANRRAGFIYLLMAHVGGLFILLSFGILAGFGEGFTFEAMRHADPNLLWMSLTFACAFLGFGMKAGLVPVHVWLPEAHPVAPSHVSALMSGIMLKVAIYGFIRVTFDLIGSIHWSWGVVLLFFACITALYGVLTALIQQDMKKMLAYSSIENIGIVFMGLALALIFYGQQHTALGNLALIAALFHCLNHALFKSLLFLGAGAVINSSREHDIDRMGGLIHFMPWTGVFFLFGCIAISALPPSNGFVSEWLLFQASLQATAFDSGVLRAIIPISAAVLALTGALAAACFVKLYGIAFLGRPRIRSIKKSREVGFGMLSAQGILVLCCLLIGLFPTFVVNLLNAIPLHLFGEGLSRATSHGWLWLTPISSKTAEYSAPLVALGLSISLIGWLVVYIIMKPKRKALRKGRVPPWDCGFGPLNSRMQYTGASFSMPIRRIFAPVWSLSTEAKMQARTGLMHHAHTQIYKESSEDWSWRYLYQAIANSVNTSARHIGKIQTGHLRHYLAYSFFTLVVLLWLIS